MPWGAAPGAAAGRGGLRVVPCSDGRQQDRYPAVARWILQATRRLTWAAVARRQAQWSPAQRLGSVLKSRCPV